MKASVNIKELHFQAESHIPAVKASQDEDGNISKTDFVQIALDKKILNVKERNEQRKQKKLSIMKRFESTEFVLN